MRKYLKLLVPKNVRRLLRFRYLIPVWLNFLYDFRRYAKYSRTLNYDNDEEKLRALVTATYHNIEKGLALESPRLGFGTTQIINLIRYIDELNSLYGPKDYLSIPLGVLGEYICFHRKHGYELKWLEDELARLQAVTEHVGQCGLGGVELVKRQDIQDSVAAGGDRLFFSRSSCRQFSSEKVEDNLVERAVRIAQKSPAVCNRQSGHVHAFRKRADIDRILESQGGARGFGHTVPILFCLTVDMRNFCESGERYQGMIDGGMFAMSFVLGLHAQGLGSCCLNWSKVQAQDKAMRRLIGLPAHETILMFVAAGHVPDEFVVARSVRKPLSEVLHYSALLA